MSQAGDDGSPRIVEEVSTDGSAAPPAAREGEAVEVVPVDDAGIDDPPLSDEELAAQQRALDEALALKARGNEHFKGGEHEAAIECYTGAIEVAPPTAAKERATFYANRAACHAKLLEHTAAIDDCTACLELDAGYTKAYLRRAAAREALDLPTEALDDAKRAAELDPASKDAAAAVARLEKASAARLEQQKEEMMGKLKDLGNSVLGKFGMSLDNFKAEKDPNTGSYNISFQR